MLRSEPDFIKLKNLYVDKIPLLKKGLLRLFGYRRKKGVDILVLYRKWCFDSGLREVEAYNVKRYFEIEQKN